MDFSFINFLIAFTLGVIFLALIARFSASKHEPEWPITTPVGKLPFFDGVIWYGLIALILLLVIALVPAD